MVNYFLTLIMKIAPAAATNIGRAICCTINGNAAIFSVIFTFSLSRKQIKRHREPFEVLIGGNPHN
jgi:hypothetical protein